MADAAQLTSVTNPRVKAVVRLRQGRQRRKTGLFIAEGCRQIGRALDAGLRMTELLWCPSMLGTRGAEVAQLRRRAVGSGDSPGLFTVAPAVLAKMAYRQNAEGVLAVFAQRQWSLEAVLSAAGGGGGLFLVAVGIEKPGNLGAMARSAAAAGVSGMIVADAVVDPMHPNALEASTGAVLDLPIVAACSEQIIAALHQHHIRIIAATPPAPGSAPGSTAGSAPGSSAAGSPGNVCSYLEADLTGRIALVIGPEDVGLSELWLTGGGGISGGGGMCQAVSIPMPGRAVDSLNAAAATAVLLFEAVRQRSPG